MDNAIFGVFDNSAEPLAAHSNYGVKRRMRWDRRLLARARGRRPSLYNGGTPHLRFIVNDKIFVYTYIRKNACSTVKRFLLDYYSIQSSDISGITSLHGALNVTFESELKNSQRILILRDPIKRACSLFRNKFIQSSFANDIQNNMNGVITIDIPSMTFRDFVTKYLMMAQTETTIKNMDWHTLPQARHLWPIYYDRVFLVDDMVAAAGALFDKEIATKYFAPKHNTSSATFFDDDCVNMPVGRLQSIFADQGSLPSDRSLLDGEVEARIREIYAVDFELMARARVGG